MEAFKEGRKRGLKGGWFAEQRVSCWCFSLFSPSLWMSAVGRFCYSIALYIPCSTTKGFCFLWCGRFKFHCFLLIVHYFRVNKCYFYYLFIIIFSPCSVLGKVRTVPYMQIYTKLTINHRDNFFNLPKSVQVTLLNINVVFLVVIIIMVKKILALTYDKLSKTKMI